MDEALLPAGRHWHPEGSSDAQLRGHVLQFPVAGPRGRQFEEEQCRSCQGLVSPFEPEGAEEWENDVHHHLTGALAAYGGWGGGQVYKQAGVLVMGGD